MRPPHRRPGARLLVASLVVIVAGCGTSDTGGTSDQLDAPGQEAPGDDAPGGGTTGDDSPSDDVGDDTTGDQGDGAGD